MAEIAERNVPLLLWPFYALWRLLTFVLEAVGRLLCGILGVVLMVFGGLLTVTVVGAAVGIPLAAAGFLLLVRALF